MMGNEPRVGRSKLLREARVKDERVFFEVERRVNARRTSVFNDASDIATAIESGHPIMDPHYPSGLKPSSPRSRMSAPPTCPTK